MPRDNNIEHSQIPAKPTLRPQADPAIEGLVELNEQFPPAEQGGAGDQPTAGPTGRVEAGLSILLSEVFNRLEREQQQR